MELPKKYNFQTTEKKWQHYWRSHKLFSYNEKKKGTAYSIDTPPPTVSGRMHIGHASSYSHGDYIARYHRMKGENVFYPFGTDDNGLPTERLVEQINKIKIRDMKRHEFIELCNKTLKKLIPEFVQDWIDIGLSADFDHMYSTITPHSIETSQYSFIDLYNKGRIYREEAPVTWCTKCQTAIAQAEFDNIDQNSHFNDIVFKEGGKDIIISTTRPELIPACVALMYHPDDKRYKKLEGKFAKVPLFNYDVPIMADKHVDPKKGTGILMVCTWGDKYDVEWWHKYNLPLRVVIEKNGTLNKLADPYTTLTLKEARKKILADLKKNKFLIGQKQITHAVNIHERCGTEIDFLKTGQWFIKVLDKKQELINIADKMDWYPKHMKVRYVHWIENLQWDWCISRQRFFGVPFPLWYCKKCNNIILADQKNLPIDPLKDKPKKKCACGNTEFIPEHDVLDTWATSALTPQIALNWINDKQHFNKNFPMGVRFQAHDLIRVWCFYTVVKSLYHHNSIPWNDVMVSGHVLSPKGEKMGKSKGNVVEPQKILKEYGADALRFWAAGSKLGDDVNYQEQDFKIAQRNITKIWNASRFIYAHLEKYTPTKPKNLETIDRWLLSKLNQLVQECTTNFENYEYSVVRKEFENFFWNTFCDNYLEIVKDRLYNDTGNRKTSAQYTLYYALLAQLKIIAPIMPHVTEEIHSHYYTKKEKQKSIHLSGWPTVDKKKIDKKIDQIGDRFVEIISDVRKHKSDHNKSLNTEITLFLDKKDTALLKDTLKDLQSVTKAKDIKEGAFKIVFA